VSYLPWRNADYVFHSLMPFFDSETYSLAILKGLITSSGGLTESTLKASSDSLFRYLSQMGKTHVDKKRQFIQKLATIFERSLREERVTIPLMKTIEMLLTSDYLSEEGLAAELTTIHGLTVQECNKSKNIVKVTFLNDSA